jgi:hypothetical protein
MGKILFVGVLLGITRWFTAVPDASLPIGLSAIPVDNRHYGTDTLQLDKETGLVIDERLNLVRAHCTSCHSPKLITQTHLTRDGWRQKIRWMQRTQKLWDLGESEPVVLDYLVKYYGPEERSFDGRRLPLPKQKW